MEVEPAPEIAGGVGTCHQDTSGTEEKVGGEGGRPPHDLLVAACPTPWDIPSTRGVGV